MHAAERYEGVVDKLRECNEQLEGTKEAVRDLALRFEEVRKRRQQLFQVSNSYNVLCADCVRTVPAGRCVLRIGGCHTLTCVVQNVVAVVRCLCPFAPAQLLASSDRYWPLLTAQHLAPYFDINMLLIIPRTATRKCRRL
jgi:hypothetical protein